MSEPPAEPSPRSVSRQRLRFRPRRGWPRGLIKLLVLCLIVGLVMSIFGIEPVAFWRAVWSAVEGVYDWLVRVAGSLAAYVVIGACVVVPIVVVRALWRRANR